jgi:hypothetical protein
LKEPADLIERGRYYAETRDFEKALATVAAVIAADPKSAAAAQSHFVCGVIHLLQGRDFVRAASELTLKQAIPMR